MNTDPNNPLANEENGLPNNDVNSPAQEQPTERAPDSADAAATADCATPSAPAASSTVSPVTDDAAPSDEKAAPVASKTSMEAPVESPSPSGNASAPPTDDAAGTKPKIQIGSQRDVAAKPAKPKAVQQAQANPVDLGQKKIETPQPVIQIQNPIDKDDEIEAMLGDLAMDQLIEKNAPNASDDELTLNSRVKAVVTRIHGDHVFATVLGRFEGVIPKSHFKQTPEEGQLVEVVVINHNEDDNLYDLAVPGASVAVADWSDLTEGAVVEARVTGSNTGGLEVVVNNIRGFIPASQIDRFRVENFGDYVNQKLQCVVMEVNPQKKKLVLSRRALLEREAEAKRKELMEQLQPGDVVDGLVTRLMDFGAFIDIGGVEGLVHVSKLAWDRVTHPQEILSPGQKIKVKIEKVEPASGRISLSYRDTMEHPWERIQEKYQPDTEVTGTVTKLAQFGAFVKLEPGIEGLVHISEIAHHRVTAVKNHLKVGDEVRVKILSIDPENQKLSLSIKATKPVPMDRDKKPDEAEEPIREMAVAKTDKPLKGGTDRSSGGEQFGLKW